ncbi:MAG: DEAD/DEAH box helicase family protein [Daejeonella sp.]
MLNNITWPESRSYRSGNANKPFQFYSDALMNSTRLDLLLGYFSSSAIHILATGFAHFLHSGGTLRMLINDVLSEKDKQAIIQGQVGLVDHDVIDLNDLPGLRRSLDEYGQHFFECLAWLVAHDRLQIKVIRPKDGEGIAHYKSGTFSDGHDAVGFKASCNFTSFGLLANLEEIEAYLSWDKDNRSELFIAEQANYFEHIFSGAADFVEYVPTDEIKAVLAREYGNKDLNELLVQEKELLILKEKYLPEPQKFAEAEFDYGGISSDQPAFPYVEGPRSYQLKAYQNWVDNGYQGLFAMATGTGKTITALNCILREYEQTGYYHFVILVPTIALANQWHEEVTSKFNFGEVQVCSSQHQGWEIRMNQFGRNFLVGNANNFCVIATYASFRGDRFQLLWNRNFSKHFHLLTLIADEAHTFGAAQLLKLLPWQIHKRIGLSATPERAYDPEGQEELCRYFNASPPAYTFVYNMKQAIDDEILCRYYYYPVLVDMLPEELEAYRQVTRDLARHIDPATGKYRDSAKVNQLLIKRKNVIHKAARKEDHLINIVDSIGSDNFRYAFIYVPEGNMATYENDDNTESDEDDERIINRYTSLLYERFQLKMRKFLGDTPDRESILNQFRAGNIDAILAMKCLDEGVDVPRTQYAIFCSSTGNPRQYVQRRGRVLRSHDDKTFAYIYDMVVKPPLDITQGQSPEHKVERNILMGELRRLVNFAALAENNLDVMRSLEDLAYAYGIDIYEMMNSELELYDI